jgi:uncharacterized membrane protein
LRARDEPIHYKQIFRGFEQPIALRIIGVYVLQCLIFLPLMMLGVILPIAIYGEAINNTINSGISFSSFLIVSWFLLSIIITIYLAIRMMFSMAFVVDQGTDPWPAIKKSFQITRCNELPLLAILICQIAIFLISGLALLIGLIWTLPLILIIYGMAYNKLRNENMNTNV